MPYCEDCAKYWAPSAMNADGTCPTCGRTVDAPDKAAITAKNLDLKKLAAGDDPDADASAPWHFKLLVVLTAGYLIWRFVQLLT